MPRNYLALRDELATAGYVGKSDTDRAAILNAPGPLVPGVIPNRRLRQWGAMTGVRKRVETQKGNQSEAPASICLGVVDHLTSGESFSLDDPKNMTLIDALVAANVMTAAEKASLVALGSVPGPSRAVVVFGDRVTAKDCAHARSLS